MKRTRNFLFMTITCLAFAAFTWIGCGGGVSSPTTPLDTLDDSRTPAEKNNTQPVEKLAAPVEAVRTISALGPDPINVTVTPDGNDNLIGFTERNPGDYNTDGTVNGLDVFPLAANFNQPVEGNPGFECIDGTGDGTLNGLDLFQISVNFSNQVVQYDIFSSTSDMGPFDTLVASEAYEGCSFMHEYRHVNPGQTLFYEVHSSLGGVTPDTDPPVWDTTTGVQEVVGGDSSVIVLFNAATDAESGPVSYNIYYDTQSPVRIGSGATKITPPEIDPAVVDFDHAWTIEGLTNDTTYHFVVRAEDSAGTPNEDTNTVEASATPAEFDYDTDIQPLFNANCTPCHIGGTSGGLNLDSPSWEKIVNVPSDNRPAMDLIEPNDQDNSYLFLFNLPESPDGQHRTDLPDTYHAQLALWIDAGAPGMPAGDTTPPTWPTLTGVQESVAGDSSAVLMWAIATDETLPVRYSIYYDTQSPVRIGSGATKLEHIAYKGAYGGSTHHRYVVEGLTNDQEYFFVVRAEDNADPSNEDTNTVEGNATPHVFDYETDIQSEWTTNCTPCHIGGSLGGLNLDSPSWSKIVNVASDNHPELDLIEPGDPDNSYLYEYNTPYSPDDRHQSPPDGMLATIERWIAAGAPGGPEPVSYSADIQPIWTANCSPCHIGGSSGGLSLSSGVSWGNLVNVEADGDGDWIRVVPGSATTSALFRKCDDDDPPFGNRMPQGRPKLNQSLLDLIETWIDQGALNN